MFDPQGAYDAEGFLIKEKKMTRKKEIGAVGWIVRALFLGNAGVAIYLSIGMFQANPESLIPKIVFFYTGLAFLVGALFNLIVIKDVYAHEYPNTTTGESAHFVEITPALQPLIPALSHSQSSGYPENNVVGYANMPLLQSRARSLTNQPSALDNANRPNAVAHS